MNASSAKTDERGINHVLAQALTRRHPRWPDAISCEQTGHFEEHRAEQPDILVRHPDGLPVVVETEVLPASSVESDATKRLGRRLHDTGDPVEVAIAVRMPRRLSTVPQRTLPDELERSEFEFCLLTDSGAAAPVRWPETGWLKGGVDTLAFCVERASLSENQVIEGMKILESGVRQAAGLLRERAGGPVLEKIAATLNQKDGEQTSRMAMAIIANAMVFHHAIAREHDVEQLETLRIDHGQGGMSGRKVVACWERILREINYWPIFRIACDILEKVRPHTASMVLNRLAAAAERLDMLGTTSRHDLCGRMFQSLIADRKFLATFYTLPSSAALLAELAANRLQLDWGDPKEVTALQIADFACGTGALLGAAYHACLSRHRLQGGDDAEIHRTMMEHSLTATDIMPAAVHLTASVLASVHPQITFRKTRIAVLPYGYHEAKSGVSIGALGLIQEETMYPLYETGEQAVFGFARTEVDGHRPLPARVPHNGFDLVIMNPPFTRPTNHASQTVPVPSFAGLGTSAAERRMMSKELKKLRLNKQAGHGNAGLASNFLDVAHAKTKPGGCLALVLPASFLQGQSWRPAREFINRHYTEVTIVSISAAGQTNRAFSADTGMAEILIIGIKASCPKSSDATVLYVNLKSRPQTVLEGAMLARAIHRLPASGTDGVLSITKDVVAGCWIRSVLAQTGAANVRELQLIRSSAAIVDNSAMPVPSRNEAVVLPLTALSSLGTRGLVDRDINGVDPQTGERRGPFDTVPLSRGEIPDHPVLWSHDAKKETRLTVFPDKRALVADGLEADAAQVWGNASRLHFNRDFQLNSQPLVACLTPMPSLGGSAWPNFLCSSPDWDVPLVLWANSTLGLICWWWIGTRQQLGRARITISKLPQLTILDPRELDATQLQRMREIWSEFEDRDFLPANEAYRDDARKALDEALLGGVLGLSQDALQAVSHLRMQWCAEPSVHGDKNTAPSHTSPPLPAR